MNAQKVTHYVRFVKSARGTKVALNTYEKKFIKIARYFATPSKRHKCLLTPAMSHRCMTSHCIYIHIVIPTTYTLLMQRESHTLYLKVRASV